MICFAILILASTFASKYSKPETNKATFNSRYKLINDELLKAVSEGNDNQVKRCLYLGAEVNVFNNFDMTPIYTAAAYNLLSTLETLVEADLVSRDEQVSVAADIDFPDMRGVTPLHAAAAEGHFEIASLLVNRGANSRLRDRFGDTPLHNAAMKGHAEIAALLFPNGVNVRNNEGNTPLHLAIANGHDNVASLLVKNGADGNLKNNDGKTATNLAEKQAEKQAKKSAPHVEKPRIANESNLLNTFFNQFLYK